MKRTDWHDREGRGIPDLVAATSKFTTAVHIDKPRMQTLLTNTAGSSLAQRVLCHCDGAGVRLPALVHDLRPLTLRVVVPNARRARVLQEQYLAAIHVSRGTPVPPMDIRVLHHHLLDTYSSLSPSPRTCVSDVHRCILLRNAVIRCAREGRLRYYANAYRVLDAASIEVLTDIVMQHCREGHTAAMLQRRSNGHEGGGLFAADKHADVCSVLAAYEETLGHHHIDIPGILLETVACLRASSQALHHTGTENNGAIDDDQPAARSHDMRPVLLFDSFAYFSESELKLLRAYADAPVPVIVVMETDAANDELFGIVNRAVRQLRDAGFHEHALASPSHASDPMRKYLHASLFAERIPHSREVEDVSPHLMSILQHRVGVVRARHRREEVQMMARYVKHVLGSTSLKPHDIAIAVRQPQLYSDLIREEFEESGIPLNMSDRIPLANTPVVTALFALLDCSLRHFMREDIERALRNPWLDAGSSHEKIDIENLLAVASRLRLAGGDAERGIMAWLEPLQQWQERLRIGLQAFTEDARESDEYRSYTTDMRRCTKAIRHLAQLHDLLSDADAKRSPRDCKKVIDDLRERFGMNAAIDEQSGKRIDDIQSRTADIGFDRLELTTRSYALLCSLVDELTDILDREKIKEISLREFVETLRYLVGMSKVSLRERRNAGVTVTSIDRLYGVPARALIVAGMVDGEFPALKISNAFRNVASINADRGDEGGNDEDAENVERLRLYHVLTNNVDALLRSEMSILFTYAKANAQMEELVPSRYLDQVRRVCGSRIIDEDEKRSDEATDADGADETSFFDREWLRLRCTKREHERQHGVHEDDVHAGLDYMQHIMNTPLLHAVSDTETSIPDDEAAPQTAMSVSAVEVYASCPYRYFAQRELGLREGPHDELSVTESERGTMLHRIAYLFLTEMLKRQEASLGPGPKGVGFDYRRTDEYRQALRAAACKVYDEVRFDHPYLDIEYDGILGLDEQRQGILDRWLKQEMQRYTDTRFHPLMFEVEFGNDARSEVGNENGNEEGQEKGNDIRTTGVMVGDRRFRGKIDRIDIRHVNDNVYEYLVVDYKTSLNGRKSNSDILKKGTSFQMPLYVQAAHEILNAAYPDCEFRAVGGLYVVFISNKEPHGYVLVEQRSDAESGTAIETLTKKNTSQVLGEDETTDAAVGASLTILAENVRRIGEGHFPVEPASAESCRYCPYPSMCRIGERRDDGDVDASEGPDATND